MDKSERLAIRIDPALKARLRVLCAERDVPEAQAVREGLRLWLDPGALRCSRKVPTFVRSLLLLTKGRIRASGNHRRR